MKYCKYVSLVAFTFFWLAHSVPAQKLDNAWLNHEAIQNAHVGFDFQDMKTGKSVHSYQSEKLLNPASTIKLLTSFVFLEEFGEDYQFKTHIYLDGNMATDGTVTGDLIIYGEGDPSLGSARYGEGNGMKALFSDIISAIKKHGVSCIDGDIIVDASYFGSDCTPHNWPYNDLGNYYASGIWSVNINENAYKLDLKRSTSRNAQVKLGNISPFIPELFFDNELTLGAANSGDQAYIFCAPYQSHAYIRGSIPVGRSTFSIRGAIPNAPLFMGQALQIELESIGIKTQNVHVSFIGRSRKNTIWEHNGIPADRHVRSALHKSINLYCEVFLKKLGSGEREKGIKIIQEKLVNSQVISSKKDIQISDGSGLSQRNFVTAKTLASFLRLQQKAHGEKYMQKYLAQNGYDGTLKNAFVSGGLKGKIYGKSGSMGGVRAYAGILTSKSGRQLSFSVMVNNYTSKSSDIYLLIQQLMTQVYNAY